jgi:hypothetical protein
MQEQEGTGLQHELMRDADTSPKCLSEQRDGDGRAGSYVQIRILCLHSTGSFIQLIKIDCYYMT